LNQTANPSRLPFNVCASNFPEDKVKEISHQLIFLADFVNNGNPASWSRPVFTAQLVLAAKQEKKGF
jgi:hypothetical protein